MAATFNNPYGLAIDASGIAYVGDSTNHRVRQIDLSTGAVSTLAGSGTAASTNGTGTSAAFSSPFYLALDGLGNLYVTDSGTHLIRKVVLATQDVTTVAGTGAAGAVDGVGIAASFNQPYGVACDASGNAFVADSGNHRIRKIVLSSAMVTTLAGSVAPSAANGVGAAAGFSTPINVVMDSSGTLLFVADFGNSLIRQIVIATQTVTTLAGSGMAGAANGFGVAAQFNGPRGLAVDASGSVYVGDVNLVRKIVIATTEVTTLAGSGSGVWVDGFGTNADFSAVRGLFIARGNMLVADGVRVRMLQPTVPCASGLYCPAATTAAVACAVGSVCVNATVQVACASGTYCPASSTTVASCAAGNECVTPASQTPCASGQYCPAATTAAAACSAGRVCVNTTTQTDCAAGQYCPAATTAAVTCPHGAYCPAPAQANYTLSPIGSFCDTTGLSAFTLCTAGMYCASSGLSAPTGNCSAGYYCPTGSSSATQVACPAGTFHCAASASAPVSIACAAGYDSDLFDRVSACM